MIKFRTVNLDNKEEIITDIFSLGKENNGEIISDIFSLEKENKNNKDNIVEIEIIEKIEDNGNEYKVTSFHDSTFENFTILKRIIFPASIEKIKYSFWDSLNLEAFIVDENNQKYCDVDGVIYDKSKKTLIAYPNKKGKIYQVPNGVIKLGNHSFKQCVNLEELILPPTIKKIGKNVFYGCSNLKKLILPDSLISIEGQYDTTPTYRPSTEFHYKGKVYDVDEIVELFKNIKS